MGLFFLFVFPIILILLLGVTFGSGFTPRVGVISTSSGELGAELVTSLRGEDIEVERFLDQESLTGAIERGEVDAGVTIPEGYDEQLRSGSEARSSISLGPAPTQRRYGPPSILWW